MSETTIIMDGKNPQKENEERTRIASQPDFQKEVKQHSNAQKKRLSVLKNVGMVVGGVGAAGIMMGFMPSKPEEFEEGEPILLPEEPPMATTINDQMNYNDAWETAREEVGPGGFFVWNDETFSTYTQEEWSQLSPEDQSEFNQNMEEQYQELVEPVAVETPVVIYEDAPLSDVVSDDMSFDDAFALARQDVGPGGVFVWKGNTYNTYYKEEWDAMDEADQGQFMASADHVVTQEGHNTEYIAGSNVNHVPEAIVVDNDDAETFIGDEMIVLDDGTEIHVGYFMNDGEVVTKLDIDNDNQFDYIADPNTNQLIGLNGNEDINIDQLNNPSTSSTPEPVMTEHVDIEGYDALVTIYSDGSQTAEIDMDGDGTYDSKMSVDANGHLEVFDQHGNLVMEDDLNQMMEAPAGVDPDPIIDTPDVAESPYYTNVDQDLIDEQLNTDFGNDFNDQGDVSGWVSDDLV